MDPLGERPAGLPGGHPGAGLGDIDAKAHRRTWSRAGLWPAALALIFISAVVRWIWSLGVAAPWIAPDEPIYGLLGRSLAGDDTVVAGAIGQYALVTPALFALPFGLTNDVAASLHVTQALQAVAMSAAGALVFAWARRVASDRWALVASAATVAVPGLAYAGLLMTEALFYPVVTLALFALAATIEQPTGGRQALFAAACALAVATRIQGVALLPAALLAIVAAALVEGSPRLLRRLAPLVVGIVLVGVGAGVALIADVPALGSYSVAARVSYDLGAVATDLWHHAGAVFLIVGGIPLVALASILPSLRTAAAPLRALVVVTLAWTVVLVAQVGVFAARWVGHLAERELLTAAPPLFAVFAAWLSLGAPRPRPWAYVAAIAVATPALLLPVGDLSTREATLDSFSTIAFRKLAEATSSGTATTIWAAWGALLVAAAMTVPARARSSLVVLVALALLPLSVVASREVSAASKADERWWFAGASPRWIDGPAAGRVAYLYAGTGDWGAVWKTAFWNRDVDHVATIGPEPVPGPMEQSRIEPRFDGLLLDSAGRPFVTPYLVAPRGMTFDGAVVASIGPSGTLAGLDLWRLDGTAILRSWVRGLTPDGTLEREGFVTGWGCAGGHLALTLVGLGDAKVSVGALRWQERRATLRLGEVQQVTVPAPPADQCEFALATTAPVAVRDLRIVRAEGDGRAGAR